jgi:hypothetical protein
MRTFETNARVLKGFPVLVQFTCYEPEPDVGFSGGIEIDDLFTITGRKADFICKRMTGADWAKLREDIEWSPDDWRQV